MRKILIIVFCSILLSGCAQTVKQHSNMLNAMNGKLTPVNYNKTYVFTTFGYPDSKSVSISNGVRTETWVYKTNMGDKDLMLNVDPWKTRYMKITIRDNIVTDVSFK